MKKILIVLILLCLCGCSNIVSGNITCDGKASDSYLNIECDSPILVRNVEMVQYNLNDNGEKELVFANYLIEGEGLDNPTFPEELNNEIFHGTIKMKDVELTDEQIECLVLNNSDDLKKIEELPSENGNVYGLIYKDGAYLSASNDWKLGEIRITYYTMDIDESKEYSVLKVEE